MSYDLNGLFNRIQLNLRSTPYLSLNELSTRIGVERHTIEKAVKQATSRTFRELRSEMLLEYARGLLDNNPHQSIKEVAFQLGYRSQRSFSRFIKSSVGCSPKELRADRNFEAVAVGPRTRGKPANSRSVQSTSKVSHQVACAVVIKE
ncbi:MAG: helix-turn-helix domain-containing protein [Acidobacteriia bacterium]|nr:helix-turn-helix domain-containing protein [Terriglobia bacterium]